MLGGKWGYSQWLLIAKEFTVCHTSAPFVLVVVGLPPARRFSSHVATMTTEYSLASISPLPNIVTSRSDRCAFTRKPVVQYDRCPEN